MIITVMMLETKHFLTCWVLSWRFLGTLRWRPPPPGSEWCHIETQSLKQREKKSWTDQMRYYLKDNCSVKKNIYRHLRFSSSRYVEYKLTFFYVLKKNTCVNILSCNNKAEEVSKKDRDGNNQRNAEWLKLCGYRGNGGSVNEGQAATERGYLKGQQASGSTFKLTHPDCVFAIVVPKQPTLRAADLYSGLLTKYETDLIQ